MAERVGFRTHDTVAGMAVFKTATFNHSVTSPCEKYTISVGVERYTIPVYYSFMRTTQRKGDLAVSQAIATFTRMGYDVALPITESAAYDIIIDVDNELNRVQVRYSSTFNVELRRIHSNSKGYVIKKTKKDAYDWLYILFPDGREYLIKECLDGRRSVNPGEKYRI